MDDLSADQNLIQGNGTRLEAWKASRSLANTPCIDPQQVRSSFERLVVVAPHPDDEILGSTALLSTLLGEEQRLLMIAVTDGEASHPDSQDWSPDALRQQRPLESRHALERLGLRSEHIVWDRLGLPDSEAASGIDQLEAHLRMTLRPHDTVLTTWRHDGHCDHEAVGQACARVTEEKGLPLIEVPLWAWHWADPEDARLPWSRARKVPLSNECLQRKRAAIAAHATQLAPQGEQPAVLTQATLQRLLQPFELIFI
ncbi:PIG-L deacetylase family protein [Pseudomonas sp. NPDC088444]|uniref:PIG-L deacetylase family protein n=1 Tax=Pseudomonas sp. NPDC088444 TaxID=3364456 RepID=UPI00384AEB00